MSNSKSAAVSTALLLFLCAHPVFPADEPAADAAHPATGVITETAPVSAPDLDDYLEKIPQADTEESALAAIEETIANCGSNEDYEKLSVFLNDLAQKNEFTGKPWLYYALALVRMGQLSFLSKSNDIALGRLYMSVNDRYYNETVEYLEKARQSAGSKELAIDICFLKFLVFKEKFQPQNAWAVFDEMIDRIAGYSPDPSKNKEELARIEEKFRRAGLTDYVIKLKIAYASRAGAQAAQEIFEEIRNTADGFFARGDMKEAALLYERYATLAGPYFEKEKLAANVMEIGEKYFSAGKYKDARKYYEHYVQDYGNSGVGDYSNYKIALCYYHEKDYVKSIAQLEKFIEAYKNSVWFDNAFETLCRLYYENFHHAKAMEGLARLIEKYYRKNVGDYAKILMAMLYYHTKDYNSASGKLKEVDPSSTYFYPAQTLLEEIGALKKGAAPSLGSGSVDTYRIWAVYKPISARIALAEVKNPSGWLGGRKIQKLDAGDNTARDTLDITVGKADQLKFRLETPEDPDRFSEYLQDKEDQSRLPKKLREEVEKDLISIQWTSDGGTFLDDKQTPVKIWQAPSQPGEYIVMVRIDDFGLVRVPDRGQRKDSSKELTVVIKVEE